MAQFKATVDILTTADSGPRDTNNLLWSVIHTTENSDYTAPDDVARWQLDRSNESSYHVLFGFNGRSVRSNDDNYSPWSVGMPGNRLGLHGAAVAYASRTRSDWMEFPDQLESIARWLAKNAREYGIPLVELTVDDVRARKRGVTTHATYWQAIAKDQGMDYRSDPGTGFPMDVVITRARELVSPPKPKGSSAVTPEQFDQLDNKLTMVLDQLGGHPWAKFPGWPQLGGRTVVNALADIGKKLGIEGMGWK